MERTTMYVRPEWREAADEISSETSRRTELPEMTRSEVFRHVFAAGWRALTDGEADPETDGADALAALDLENVVSESTRVRLRREAFLDDEGWLTNMRAGFRARVADQFRSRFRQGWNPDELEAFAENMRREAYLVWPEDLGEDYSDDREAALEYVDELVAAAREAWETTDVRPLDPEEVFSHFSGVESGERREAAPYEVLVDESKRRLKAGRVERDLVRSLANQYDTTEEVAREAVDEARDELDDDEISPPSRSGDPSSYGLDDGGAPQ